MSGLAAILAAWTGGGWFAAWVACDSLVSTMQDAVIGVIFTSKSLSLVSWVESRRMGFMIGVDEAMLGGLLDVFG